MNVSLPSFLCVGLLLMASTTVQAETTVTVKETHLCCPVCVSVVGKVMEKVEGATAECDRKEKSITIKAKNDRVAKRALTALAKAGFHGKSDHEKLKIVAGLRAIPKGKVSRIELAGVHNCCGACAKAIKTAVTSVKGVAAETVKAKETSFVVEGDFNARAVVRALNKAGFHVGLKKDKEEEAKKKQPLKIEAAK